MRNTLLHYGNKETFNYCTRIYEEKIYKWLDLMLAEVLFETFFQFRRTENVYEDLMKILFHGRESDTRNVLKPWEFKDYVAKVKRTKISTITYGSSCYEGCFSSVIYVFVCCDRF